MLYSNYVYIHSQNKFNINISKSSKTKIRKCQQSKDSTNWRTPILLNSSNQKKKNTNILQAKWKNDEASGSGYFISPDGTELIGIWKNNQLHGTKNKIRYPSGSEYEGNTEYSAASGYGILTTQEIDIFQGTWVNNELNGYAHIIYQDGNSYRGFIQNNEKCGWGVYSWTNGNVYTGYWYKDELHGDGVLQTHGKVYHGPWELGQQL